MIDSFVEESKVKDARIQAKDARIQALRVDKAAQTRLFKEASLAHEKVIKEYESQIHYLKRDARRFQESADQALVEKQRVSHTHIYIQTLLHKQHTQTSHGVIS